jgi:hypothetical protein
MLTHSHPFVAQPARTASQRVRRYIVFLYYVGGGGGMHNERVPQKNNVSVNPHLLCGSRYYNRVNFHCASKVAMAIDSICVVARGATI